jgi:hypothetical protein
MNRQNAANRSLRFPFVNYFRFLRYVEEEGDDENLVVSFCLFMGTSLHNFALLGGKGNALNLRRH